MDHSLRAIHPTSRLFQNFSWNVQNSNTLKVLTSNSHQRFQVLYDEYREVYIPEMVREGGERKASLASVMSGKASTNWDFASHLVFAKYDTYIARVQQVKVTAIHFAD